jgi:hypothetical protein
MIIMEVMATDVMKEDDTNGMKALKPVYCI